MLLLVPSERAAGGDHNEENARYETAEGSKILEREVNVRYIHNKAVSTNPTHGMAQQQDIAVDTLKRNIMASSVETLPSWSLSRSFLLTRSKIHEIFPSKIVPALTQTLINKHQNTVQSPRLGVGTYARQ